MGYSEICDLLQRLGVTRNYKGFMQTVYAIELCRKEPERLELVTKRVYPQVARQCRTSGRAVEKNIERVRDMIWRENRPLLEKLARAPLREMPYPAQLLSILASCLAPGPLAVHGLGEAIALAGEDHNVGVVDQAVNQGGSKTVVPKDGIPLTELRVGGNDKAPALVTVRNHLKQQLGALLVQRHKADLVHHDELHPL